MTCVVLCEFIATERDRIELYSLSNSQLLYCADVPLRNYSLTHSQLLWIQFLSSTVTTELLSLYYCDFCLACYRRKTIRYCVSEDIEKESISRNIDLFTTFALYICYWFCTLYFTFIL